MKNGDLISRSALLNAFRDFKDMDCPSGHTVTADYMIELAEDAPAVDAEPVRHGRWEHLGPVFKGGVDWYRCSACGQSESGVYAHRPYCSVYGAKMDGDEDAVD